MTTDRLNFSWLVDGEVAGHAGPASADDLAYLKARGIRALVRMEEEHMAVVTPDQVREQDLADLHVPAVDRTPPTPRQTDRMIRYIEGKVAGGNPVGVSCHAASAAPGRCWPAAWSAEA